jgi:heat shock protein HtpX
MRRSADLGHTFINLAHTLILFVGMLLVLGVSGYALFGPPGVYGAVLLIVISLVLSPRISPRTLLRLYGAVPLTAASAPELDAMLRELARRANLTRIPQLYYVPSQVTNAFAVGSPRDAAIGVTDGLLRRLTLRELAGVLAHELSHVRHNDLWVMNFADVLSRVTSLLANVGQLLLLINLPLVLMGQATISWLAIAMLIVAPLLNGLLQLALSRTREYDADRGAVALTGDPAGLASALLKLERYTAALLRQIVVPGHGVPQPSILRTHPPTRDRIARLERMAAAQGRSFLPEPETLAALPPQLARIERRPRYRVMGLWY